MRAMKAPFEIARKKVITGPDVVKSFSRGPSRLLPRAEVWYKAVVLPGQFFSKRLSNDLAYSDLLKEHLAHPRCAGELADATAVAEETNPVCGDRLRLSLRVRGGRVEAARFLAYGCAAVLACGSALASMVEGMTLEEAARVTRQEVARAVGGLPTRKGHAAALAVETLRAALAAEEATS
jgi:nitrogen fixation NifU-like protein